MDLARQLAETLRRQRQAAGLTQAAMARRLGISQPTLNRIESASQNVTLRTLTQLCRALHAEPGELFRSSIPSRARPRQRRRM